MKQILVDMDGVLADVYAQFQKFEKEETGNTIASDEIVGKTELEAFPNGSKHIQSEGFFRSAPTIPGSIKGLDYLNTHYKVWVVSSEIGRASWRERGGAWGGAGCKADRVRR